MKKLCCRPLHDVMQAMAAALDASGMRGLALMLAALFASWWLYVPWHELMHAWGCLLAGGEISRLEIDRQYGGALIAQWLPYVVPASDYAGRLSGFDTHGRDTVYVVTVLAPYVWTVLIGVPALRWARRHARAWALGAALPWALAPFLSLQGDYYELGSIVVSRLAEPFWPGAVARWRSDDLILLLQTWWAAAPGVLGWGDWVGLLAGFLLGGAAAWATYWAGVAWARLLGRLGSPAAARPA